MLNKNYQNIKLKLEVFASKYLENSIELLRLLDKLKKENSNMIVEAKKLELLSASLAYIYLKKHKLNGRGGITAKKVGEFFDVKPTAISAKAFDVEFYINGGKLNIHHNKPYEFIDKDRYEANILYFDFLESEESNDIEKSIKFLKQLIKKDPNYFDPYIRLYDYYYNKKDFDNASNILNIGYQNTMKLVLNNGKFPDKLPWGYIENRHIIRMIFHFAISLWEIKEKKEALGILQKLLKSNINDNIGARYTIVAILDGFDSQDSYEDKFMIDGGYGLDAMALEEWFNKASIKHKDSIGWWFDNIEE